jgi:sugar phosphate permease
LRYRWAVLAAGTLAQASYTAITLGLAVLAPVLRVRYGLSLTEIGVVLAAPNAGSILTLYAWGVATDRYGERVVIVLGLAAATACLVAAAFARSFWPLALYLFVAGAVGASVSSASGRAVLHWFEAGERGLALGIRQTAVPIGGAWTAFVLPALATKTDPRPALLALAAGLFVGAFGALAVLREGPETIEVEPGRVERPLRDRAMWLLSLGSGCVIAPQVCVVGFLVVFLHGHRGLSTVAAGAVLGVVNLLGIGTRIGAGRWSDLVGSRLVPLRLIALASALLVVVALLVLSAPLPLLIPVLVVTCCIAISWNGLSFTAAAEAAGHARSGTALGLQQTVLAVSGAAYPVAFGALVAGTSWRAGYAVVALVAFLGWRLLISVPDWRMQR